MGEGVGGKEGKKRGRGKVLYSYIIILCCLSSFSSSFAVTAVSSGTDK